MRKLILFIILFSPFAVFSQTDSALIGKWVPTGVAGFNISQVALSNWSQGGESSITWGVFLNFFLKNSGTDWTSTNNLKAAFGMTKSGDREFRNNDNELFLEDMIAYNIGWVVDPFFSNTFRTVIANGYDYKDTIDIQKSAFFDPGYITQSLGFTWNKEKKFTSRLGIAIQEIFTKKFYQYTDKPETPEKFETFRFETGIESVSEATLALDDNVLYTTRLRLFSQFKSLDVWDTRWDNTITAKVGKYINVNLAWLVIYERMQTPKTQIKEALQLGLSFDLF